MTRARMLISLAVCLLLVGGAGLGYCYRRHQQSQALATELAATEQLLAPLDKVVTLQFEDGTLLRDWLAEFTRQSGIEVEFASAAEEYLPPTHRVRLDAETPLHLRVPPLRAEEFLNLLGELYEVPWTLRNDGRVLLKSSAAKEETIVRQLPLPAEIRPEEQQEFHDLLWDYASLTLDNRTSDDLNPHVVMTRGGNSVVAPLKRARLIEHFSQRLAAAYQRSRDLPPFGANSNDPAFQPIWLEVEPAAINELGQVLERPVTLNVVDMPFTDLAASLSQQVKFPIVLHPAANIDFHRENALATCRLSQQPLRTLPDHLPAQDGLELFPTNSGKLLILGPRTTATNPQFQLLAAYPVGDLTLDERGEDHSSLLLLTLDDCLKTDGPRIYPVHHHAKYSYAGGRLLIIANRYDVHVQIQRVLAALRQARNERVRNVAVADQYEPLDPNQQAILQRRITLQYSDATFEDIAKDQLDRGLVPLVPVGEARPLFRGQTPVWCYLPERPLGENLRAVCSLCGFQLIEQRDHLRVRWREQLELNYMGLACEVFDLRPGLLTRSDEHWPLPCTVSHLLRDRVKRHREDDRFQVQQFRDLLVAHCGPEQLPHIRELLRVLEERANSPEPHLWRGQIIAEEALYEPLTIWPADPALVSRDESLRHKLLARTDVNFRSAKLGDILLALANRHQLPIVVRSILPNNRRLNERISYTATDQTMEKILSDLIGDPEVISWDLQAGCFTVVENYRRKQPQLGYWYSVADLLRPHGPYRSQELENLLAEKSRIAGITRNDRSIDLYFTGLLHLSGVDDDRAWLQEQLRLLRSGVAAREEL